MNKKYKVHQYDRFFQVGHPSHFRATYFFDTLEEAKAFEKDSNEASKKYGFTSYYKVEE